MKFLKSLLLTTTVLAALSTDASAREGTYVGVQVGSTKSQAAKSTNGSVRWKTAGAQNSNRWDWNGGVFATHEWIEEPHSVLGVTLAAHMENNKSKQNVVISNITRESKVQRKYVVSLLGKAGYANFHKKLLPYVTAGAALTRFRFDVATANGANAANLSKTTLGWAGGVGLDYMINTTTDVGVQYLYTWYANTKKTLAVQNQNYTVYAPKAYHAATLNVRVKI